MILMLNKLFMNVTTSAAMFAGAKDGGHFTMLGLNLSIDTGHLCQLH